MVSLRQWSNLSTSTYCTKYKGAMPQELTEININIGVRKQQMIQPLVNFKVPDGQQSTKHNNIEYSPTICKHCSEFET